MFYHFVSCLFVLFFIQCSFAQSNNTCSDGEYTLLPCNVTNGIGVQLCNNTVLSPCNATACNSGYELNLESTNIYSCLKIESTRNTQLIVIGSLIGLFFIVTFGVCIVVIILGVKGYLQRKRLKEAIISGEGVVKYNGDDF